VTREIQEFYDEWQVELLLDFVNGNPRASAGIRFAIKSLQNLGTGVVVDLGCGMGWSSAELVRSFPCLRVHAVDLSPKLLQIGRELFPDPRLTFGDEDVTKPGWRERSGLPSTVDAFVMLDVYEHIPAEARPLFHSALAESLSPTGSVILTCPSSMHQEHLRKHNPRGLQPVDEDLSLSDVMRFARDLSAEVVHFEYVSVWNTNDYFHAAIVRNPRYQPVAGTTLPIVMMPDKMRREVAKRSMNVLTGAGRVRLESAVEFSLARWARGRLRRIIRGH